MHVPLKLVFSQRENAVLLLFDHSDQAVDVAGIAIEQEYFEDSGRDLEGRLVDRESHEMTNESVLNTETVIIEVLKQAWVLLLKSLRHVLI